METQGDVETDVPAPFSTLDLLSLDVQPLAELEAEPPVLPLPAPPASRRTFRERWRDNRRTLAIALLGTLGLRVVSEVVGLIGRYGASFPRVVGRNPGVLLGLWTHWDAKAYLSIAQYGYAGRAVGHGQVASGTAFAPLYPWSIRLVHDGTRLTFVASAELLSAVALVVAVATLHRIATRQWSSGRADAVVIALLAFPTAFFLLAPYPDSLALCFVLFSLLSARRGMWLLAGILAAGATLTTYYLGVVVVALCVEVFVQRNDQRNGPHAVWEREVARISAVTLPTLAALGCFMAYQQSHVGNAYAFVHAQQMIWHRHIAAPWALFHHTVSDLIHWHFTQHSVAGVTEVIDFVSVLVLAVAAVYTYLKIRRSYGIFLGLCSCVYTCQTFLLGVTRGVLALFPLFLCLGVWVSRRPWRERAMLVLFLPCGYFLIQRFVTGLFAG